MFILFFFFHTPKQAKPVPASWREIFLQMDPLGLIAIISALICYILALEWGGVTKAWSSADVIGTLIGWILLTIVFIGIQIKNGERALLVVRLMKNRTVASCCTFIFLSDSSTQCMSFPKLLEKANRLNSLNSANFLLIYYLPIYFQAIDNTSPIESGVRNLPLILASCNSPPSYSFPIWNP